MSDETIEDKLRAILKSKLASNRAYKGAHTRVLKDIAAHDKKLQRKLRQAAIKARWAPKVEPKPKPTVDPRMVGSFRRDFQGNRVAVDRFARVWIITKDERGWHAEGPSRIFPEGRQVPRIHRATSAEIRSKLRTLGQDLRSYYRFE